MNLALDLAKVVPVFKKLNKISELSFIFCLLMYCWVVRVII